MAEWSKNQWTEQWKAQRLAREAEQGTPSQTFVQRILAERGQLADPNLDVSGFAVPGMTKAIRSYKAAVAFTKKGNAVGFTSRGEPIHGSYHAKTKAWRVQVGDRPSLADVRNQNFGSERDAAEYAASLLDEEKTRALAWW